MLPPTPLSLVLQGLVLGLSVAWPPGPINLEIVRRASREGFRAGFLVGCGALCGDFIWALVTNTGASFLARDPRVKLVLGIVSTVFLLVIVGSLLSSWYRGRTQAVAAADDAVSRRNGFLFGFLLCLVNPWNAAFWLVVAGQGVSLGGGVGQSLLLAASVSLGAAIWVLVLAALAGLGKGKLVGRWQRHSELIAAVLMLLFAGQAISRLFFP